MLGQGLKHAIESENYHCDWVTDGHSASAKVIKSDYQLVILDLGLPGKDGLQVLQQARSQGVDIPILILTARDTLQDKISGLDLGADDYLLKPFELDELLARIRAQVRRYQRRFSQIINHGELELDIGSQQCSYQNKPITLSRREFALLADLLQHKGQVRSKDQLTEALYSWQDQVESNTVEVHIHHLRKKINNKLIRTLRGIGYMIERE
ncbi:DNA-binding response regulator [Pelagibaculum spongiae]|uniref:DNA-binding response regulator n=2 Tax=Pelagibaculum spongiae TaxID=2080658 RepID=A0A2V1GY62_9GAMM|nr:DNA-binding response regulator [Pelagibaculum spongiae]